MFQKAMCNYKTIDRIDRDTSGAIKSIQLFKQLLKAYPDSPYSNEARTRIASTAEFLANHEYFVAQYYIRSEKYSQAIVRLRYLLAVYPDSEIAGQAKDLLTQVEAGEPPRSWLTKWFPKVELPGWSFFTDRDKEDSAAQELER